jgi:NlpC/P60 family/Bacterial dipeptidyl-peptidase Sh3 domain
MTILPEMTGKAASPRVCFHLTQPSVKLDPRIHAVRHDLADVSLAGILFAPHYAKAKAKHCSVAGVALREKNAVSAPAVSQLLHGETFHVLDITGDWAWGFCEHDGYVGYIERSSLTAGEMTPTYRISASAAPLFSGASIKSPIKTILPIGAQLDGAIEGDFLACTEGFVHTRHITPLTDRSSDWVSAAQAYLGQPYVWGGRGFGGIDCSGLVQMALAACGVKAPRDSDMQRESIGIALDANAPLQRGDIVFFPGHVGIMTDGENMIHANAYWMATVIEPLADVVARLDAEHDQPILAKRRIAT